MSQGAAPPSADEILRRFRDELPRFERARDDVLSTIRDVLARGGIDAALSARVKDIESFRGKLELRTDYTDPWNQITDKIGVRAIVHKADDVDEIHRLIEEDGRLHIYDTTDKRTMLGEKELGYSGLHLDLHAPAEAEDTEPVPVELQIRTIAQHAWSEVSHRLLYKPPVELDDTDKRAIYRLVALVELFDGEVGRVIDKLPPPQEPSPERLNAPDLVALVNANYALFESNSGQRELTQRTMAAVAEALSMDGVTGYSEALPAWVASNTVALAQLYEDFGPSSDMSSVSDYVLWSQPESIALLESLEHRPNALLASWREHGLPERWLKSLAAHTSTAIDFEAQ